MNRYKKLFKATYEKSFEDEIFGRAAEIAFYFLFSIFPFLLFLTTLFGLVLKRSDELQTQLFLYLGQVMPATAHELVQKTLQEAVQQSSGNKMTIGLIITLWSSSAGFDSFSAILNRIYGIKETRSWWQIKLTSLFLAFFVSILILVVLTLNFFGLELISDYLGETFAKILGNILFLMVSLFIFGLVDSFCPNSKRRSFVSWGVLTSVLLWVMVSTGFSLYLRFFDNYARIYGSLGTVIILTFWFYLSALAILIGAEINSILRRETKNVLDDSRNS